MKSKAWTGRVIAIAISSAFIATGFQNCAQPTEIPLEELQSQSSTSSLDEAQKLDLPVPAGQISPGADYQLSAVGGTPPYVYYVVSGPGSVAGNTFKAGSSAGAVVVGVMDSKGKQVEKSIQIFVSNPVATGKSCTTPWGEVIEDGGSVKAFKDSSVGLFGNCQSQTRVCSNGSLSGTYTKKSCSKSF